MGPQALLAAGQLADGILPNLAGPRVVEGRIVPTIAGAARAAGRAAPRIVAAVPAVVTDAPDEVRATAAARTAFSETVPSCARMVAEEGVARAADLALIGDEETAAAGLRRYVEAGATEIVLTNTDLGGTAARARTWRLAGALTRVGAG